MKVVKKVVKKEMMMAETMVGMKAEMKGCCWVVSMVEMKVVMKAGL